MISDLITSVTGTRSNKSGTQIGTRMERKLERSGTQMNANGTQIGTQIGTLWNANGMQMVAFSNAFSVRLFLNSTV